MRRILVIDDSALIRRVVEMALDSETGWRVQTAESGADGVELAGRECPDAILLDVEMPGLGGPATLHALREQDATRQVPVLFLTGRSAERQELEGLGAVGVIAKPFDPAQLAAQVSRALGW